MRQLVRTLYFYYIEVYIVTGREHIYAFPVIFITVRLCRNLLDVVHDKSYQSGGKFQQDVDVEVLLGSAKHRERFVSCSDLSDEGSRDGASAAAHQYGGRGLFEVTPQSRAGCLEA